MSSNRLSGRIYNVMYEPYTGYTSDMGYWKRTPHHHLMTEVKFISMTSVIKTQVSYNFLKL